MSAFDPKRTWAGSFPAQVLTAKLPCGRRVSARRRRGFITLFSAAAVIWPLEARSQQEERTRRIGWLAGGLAANDPESQARKAAFLQRLRELGWTEGQNVRIDYRWGAGSVDVIRKHAAELIALAPDVTLTIAGQATHALQQESRTTGGLEMQLGEFGSALSDVVVHFGYGAVFVLIFLESAGIPLPGETALVTASVLAATTEGLDISLIIIAAAAGAILGDNLGFWVGHRYGFAFLRRYGRYVRLSEDRIPTRYEWSLLTVSRDGLVMSQRT